MSLALHVYRARLRAVSDVAFGGFPGPALRGALGDDLDVYAALLAPPPALPQKRFADAPRPLLLRPRFGAGPYAEGSALELDFTLVGSAGAHLPALVRALVHLGQRGVGERRNEGGGRFTLERLDARGPAGRTQAVVTPAGLFRPTSLPWHYPADFTASPGAAPLALDLRTPTFVNARGLPRGSLELGDLAADVLRRLSLLSQAYGDGPVHTRAEEDALLAAARDVSIADAAVRFTHVERYSRRQGRPMEFGGWLGRVEYDTPAAAWHPLFRAAALVHAGKHTAFGFGHVVPA